MKPDAFQRIIETVLYAIPITICLVYSENITICLVYSENAMPHWTQTERGSGGGCF